MTPTSCLVTGGTGSFGQAYVRHLLALGCKRIVVLSRDELKQAKMSEALGQPERVRFYLGDVRDEDRLRIAFQGVDVVVHAAALKRVDRVASDTEEIVKTNIAGTQNVLRAALRAGVGRVLFVSSDKGCRPTNVYGVSKAMAEFNTIGWNAYSVPRSLRCSVVRYGNVLGSRGSVIHLWRQAVREGRPIPLTDERMTRFWITLDWASKFVDQALEAMRGGEIFVPGLPATRMVDLAEALAPGHPRTIIGLRAGGEKLHEELMTDEEMRRSRINHPWGYVIPPHLHSWAADWSDLPAQGMAFPYRSDCVPRISVAQIARMLKAVPEEA